jgi:ketosteroid isomerase-like protein
MSQENLDVVRAALESWNRSWRDRDADPALDTLDRDVVLDLSGNVFNPRVLKGHQGYRQLLTEVAEVWDEVTFEVEKLIPTDDGVLTLVIAHARGRASGASIETRVAQLFTLRDGKITRIHAYSDREEAFAALGYGSRRALVGDPGQNPERAPSRRKR